MATHYSKDKLTAYEIYDLYPECPIRRHTSARCMTSARIDYEITQDGIIKWYEQNKMPSKLKRILLSIIKSIRKK